MSGLCDGAGARCKQTTAPTYATLGPKETSTNNPRVQWQLRLGADAAAQLPMQSYNKQGK